MQEFELTIDLPNGETEDVVVPEGTTILELAKEYEAQFDNKIVLAKVNGKLRELNKKVKKSGTISFLTLDDRDGTRAYRRSVTILLQKAIYKLWKNEVHVKVCYSLGEGYYCELFGSDVTSEVLEQISTCMKEYVEKNFPIEKKSVKTEDAEELFEKFGMHDKARLLHYRRSSRVNLYCLDGMVDYFYGYMLPSTGYLSAFSLEPYGKGFVLLFPKRGEKEVASLQTSSKLHQTLNKSKVWSNLLEVGSIGALNDAISEGRGEEIILLQESLMEQNIGQLASLIAERKDVKFVMIAGPSSSGKTTFSNRLSIQLAAQGLRPHPIGLDDYYIDRSICPRDANGELDLECLEAIDVEKFNEDMTRLLAGEEIEMPSFNFKTGKREYRGKRLKLSSNDILVIEGIHGLNPKLSYSLPDESKFRIYISALTQLNIDEHNPLPTTDGRLLRRIVRDARTRGTSAQQTIAMWSSVRRGEEKYIFPFQDSADVMFNSALVYEIAVLKIYAEPLLFQIPKDAEEYLEAKRLLKFLDYFLPLPTEGIAQNSLVREFIGGSCFNV